MIWTRAHIAAFLARRGHDPEQIFARCAAKGSTRNDREAWAILREWYDANPRMSKEMIAEELGIEKYKFQNGLTYGRQWQLA